ncbi:hypothetical protein TNCV_2287821 [Trichonephila clavipes]|nr:hypothetical protein TNCV_2287821 [Trichonephila clavipes]
MTENVNLSTHEKSNQILPKSKQNVQYRIIFQFLCCLQISTTIILKSSFIFGQNLKRIKNERRDCNETLQLKNVPDLASQIYIGGEHLAKKLQPVIPPKSSSVAGQGVSMTTGSSIHLIDEDCSRRSRE